MLKEETQMSQGEAGALIWTEVNSVVREYWKSQYRSFCLRYQGVVGSDEKLTRDRTIDYIRWLGIIASKSISPVWRLILSYP